MRKTKIIALFISIFLISISGCIFSPDAPSENTSPQNTQISTEVVAQNLDVPWAIAFLPDSRMIFTERSGKVKILENGIVSEVQGVVQLGESGLQGIAIDPEFETNNYIYLYYTYSEDTTLYNKVSRFTLRENSLSDEFVLLEKIPGNVYHDGGRIKFGHDGFLYITTGDAGTQQNAQDTSSLAGKILRIAKNGTIPSDNPFGNAVYSYGHRNPQGLDWDSKGTLVATEHGPSKYDEVNLIERGKNYGWPTKLCKTGEMQENFTEALVCFDSWTMAPSGSAFYTGNKLPFNGAFIYGGLRGEQIRIAYFENGKTLRDEKLLDGFGRIREIVQGPDGYLYFATNNTDGRGTPTEQDDKIYRIVAKG